MEKSSRFYQNSSIKFFKLDKSSLTLSHTSNTAAKASQRCHAFLTKSTWGSVVWKTSEVSVPQLSFGSSLIPDYPWHFIIEPTHPPVNKPVIQATTFQPRPSSPLARGPAPHNGISQVARSGGKPPEPTNIARRKQEYKKKIFFFYRKCIFQRRAITIYIPERRLKEKRSFGRKQKPSRGKPKFEGA